MDCCACLGDEDEESSFERAQQKSNKEKGNEESTGGDHRCSWHLGIGSLDGHHC